MNTAASNPKCPLLPDVDRVYTARDMEALGADRVFVLSEGRLVMEGTPKEVFNERALLEGSRLEAPAFVKLRDELIASGLPVSHEAMTCETLADELANALRP